MSELDGLVVLALPRAREHFCLLEQPMFSQERLLGDPHSHPLTPLCLARPPRGRPIGRRGSGQPAVTSESVHRWDSDLDGKCGAQQEWPARKQSVRRGKEGRGGGTCLGAGPVALQMVSNLQPCCQVQILKLQKAKSSRTLSFQRAKHLK